MRPFRVIVAIDRERVSRPVAELLSSLNSQPQVEVDCLIISGERGKWQGLSRTMKGVLLSFARVIELGFMVVGKRPRPCVAQVDVEGIVGRRTHHLEAKDSHGKEIGLTNANLAINASTAIEDAELTRIIGTTVISSSTSREPLFLGFVETCERRRSLEFSVSMTKPESPVKTILVRGRLQTRLFYLESMCALADNANHYLLNAVASISVKGDITNCGHREYQTLPTLHEPSFWSLITYSVRITARLMKKLGPRILNRRLKWSVALTRDDWRSGSINRHITLKNRPNTFSADPFIVTRNGETVCFIEEYDFNARKGAIVCYRIAGERFERLGFALKEDFHLSFPFVFEANGNLYMCPETSENRDVRIYECNEFPLGWRLCSIALSNVLAVDTVVFRHAGRWWLVTCANPLGQGTQFSELRIFAADSPTAGDWTPHSLNPITIDEVAARNGGFFTHNGSFYRVNQLQGFDVYGEAVGINRIVELDLDSFREDPIQTLETHDDGIVGLHHFSTVGDLSAFDFSRYE